MSNFKTEMRELAKLTWFVAKSLLVAFIAQQAIWAAWVVFG